MGGVIGWTGLHAIGGVIGGAVGTSLVTGLDARKIATKNSGYKEMQPNFVCDSE
jgi:hypothetical protein